MLELASKTDPAAQLAIGGLIVLGLLALASSGRSGRRRDFREVLRDELHSLGLSLVAAEFGRQRGSPVWVVTTEVAGRGVATVTTPVETPDPHSEQAANEVARRVANLLGGAA